MKWERELIHSAQQSVEAERSLRERYAEVNQGESAIIQRLDTIMAMRQEHDVAIRRLTSERSPTPMEEPVVEQRSTQDDPVSGNIKGDRIISSVVKDRLPAAFTGYGDARSVSRWCVGEYQMKEPYTPLRTMMVDVEVLRGN